MVSENKLYKATLLASKCYYLLLQTEGWCIVRLETNVLQSCW